MGSDLLRRVRWGNVALACAVLVALAGVVVWPLITTTAPSLPADAARPLVSDEPAPAGERPRPRAKKGLRRDAARTRKTDRSAARRRKTRSAVERDRRPRRAGRGRGDDGKGPSRQPDGEEKRRDRGRPEGRASGGRSGDASTGGGPGREAGRPSGGVRRRAGPCRLGSRVGRVARPASSASRLVPGVLRGHRRAPAREAPARCP